MGPPQGISPREYPRAPAIDIPKKEVTCKISPSPLIRSGDLASHGEFTPEPICKGRTSLRFYHKACKGPSCSRLLSIRHCHFKKRIWLVKIHAKEHGNTLHRQDFFSYIALCKSKTLPPQSPTPHYSITPESKRFKSLILRFRIGLGQRVPLALGLDRQGGPRQPVKE